MKARRGRRRPVRVAADTGTRCTDALHMDRVKLEPGSFESLKIVTVGSRSFVTSFQLAGVPGVITETSEQAFDEISRLSDDADVGLVLVNDDVSGPINDKLTALRAEKSTLVFSLPSVGGKKTDVDYRVMLKKILGV